MIDSMLISLRNQGLDFLPRFYRLALSSALSNMMVPLAGLCDVAFLGHLTDIRYLAGVILGSILFDYLYRVLKFLRNSANAITAQAVGRDDQQGVLLAGLRSGLIALGIAVLILLLQYPIQKLGFALLSGSPTVESIGVDYFNARIWGAPAVLLNFVLFGWFLGQEKTGIVLLVSAVGNGSNVLLDYLMISRWGWGSVGSGWATAISQYLALLINLTIIGGTIQWPLLNQVRKNLLDWRAIRSSLMFKTNILIRFIVLISVYAIFTNLSAMLGTETLAENGLMLQVALLSQFTVNGFGLTTQTLVGNFKGQGEYQQIQSVMIADFSKSLIFALGFALTTVLLPKTVFGLLTNHAEVSQELIHYTIWLLPLLTVTSIAFMLEGFFVGVKQTNILRNAALISSFAGFLPSAIAGYILQNNHLLWASLVGYMTLLVLILSGELFRFRGLKIPTTNPPYHSQSSHN
ncbi:MAG: guanitoxin biosynthesis MATE family efflux transporter GntT [Microcoleaceae cyanobacterium]